MSQRNSLPPSILKLTIKIPFGARFEVQDLATYLERVSPRVTLDIGSDLESELTYTSEDLSVGASTTRSEASYQRRARGFLLEEASEASLGEVVEELDREVESEPDGETLGSQDSARITQDEEDDLSFISYSDNFREIVDVENWRARNDAQDRRLFHQTDRALRNSSHRVPRRARPIAQVIDLTDEPDTKRTRFE